MSGFTITCIATPRSKKGAFAIIYDMAAWPVGTLTNRGWFNSTQEIYRRPATADEVKEKKEAKRMLAFRYKDWESLARDEAKYGIDAKKLAKRELFHES